MRLSVNSHHYSTQNTKTASSKMYQSLQKPKIENISLTLLHTQVHTSTEIQKQFDKEQWDSLAFKNGIFAWYWERILVPLAAGLCYWRKSSSSPEYCIFFKKNYHNLGSSASAQIVAPHHNVKVHQPQMCVHLSWFWGDSS